MISGRLVPFRTHPLVAALIAPSAGDTARIGYLPGVDGLRTIAVVSVILFHLGLGWIPGGFVGVDVFFVISGFVVATSVRGVRFDRFRDFVLFFYARRIVRIMPALLLCLVVTAVLAGMFIPPVWLSDANSRTALFAVFGLSNIALAGNTDTYFSPRAEFNPYTHTWSLGVEEQFYFIFPLLWFFWCSTASTPAARSRVRLGFLVLSLASLLCAAILGQTRPQFAFYMIFSRFWELGTGILLSATLPVWSQGLERASPGRRNALAALAVGLLATGFLFARADHFPFPWAIVPVAGTALAICLVVAVPGHAFGRILASAPMTMIGRRSYSLYLWHWPVFVLMRWTTGLETPVQLAAALALTVLAACASYSLVEEPIRRGKVARLARGAVIAGGIACAVVSYGTLKAVFRYDDRYLLQSVTREAAVWFPSVPVTPAEGCTVDISRIYPGTGQVVVMTPSAGCGADPRTLSVIGDSHALGYHRMFSAVAAARGLRVEIYNSSGVPCPLFRLDQDNASAAPVCAGYVDNLVRRVAENARPGDILFLPALRLPRMADQWGEVAPPIDDPDRAQRNGDRAAQEAVALLSGLDEKGVRILIEAPKPVFRVPLFRCSDWFNRGNPVCAGGTVMPRELIETMRAPMLDRMARIGRALPATEVWDPLPLLCGETECDARRDGKPLVFDADHLTGHANDLLLDSFLDRIGALAPDEIP